MDGLTGVLLCVLLPQQHQGHAFASKFLVQFGVVGYHKVAAAHRCGQQAVVQCRLIHVLDLPPRQASSSGELDVFGHDSFGQTKHLGDALVRVVAFEFET